MQIDEDERLIGAIKGGLLTSLIGRKIGNDKPMHLEPLGSWPPRRQTVLPLQLAHVEPLGRHNMATEPRQCSPRSRGSRTIYRKRNLCIYCRSRVIGSWQSETLMRATCTIGLSLGSLLGANVPGIGHDGPNTRAVCCLRRSQMRFAKTLFECHCRVLLKQAVGCLVYVATHA